jgi:hypothetical protein
MLSMDPTAQVDFTSKISRHKVDAVSRRCGCNTRHQPPVADIYKWGLGGLISTCGKGRSVRNLTKYLK